MTRDQRQPDEHDLIAALYSDVADLQDENERLREMLREIAEYDVYEPATRFMEIAERALASRTEPKP